jgi:uncharacterized OB-fold protein
MTDDLPDERPRPVADALTEPYWQAARRGELCLQRCGHCEWFIHAPMPRCPRCHRADGLAWSAVSGDGYVYSFMVAHNSRVPGYAGRPPNLVAMIELVEQPRLFVLANVTDLGGNELHVGDSVRAHFEDSVGDVVVPQFRRC